MSSTWASVVPAGKVPKDTTPTTSTASLPVLARRFRADPHEIGRIEGIGPDLWKLGAAATRASVGRDTAPGISLLMEWWTIHHRAALLSLARAAAPLTPLGRGR